MKNQKENAGFLGGSTIKKVSVNQVVIPQEYSTLYDYTSKNREIELLKESIEEIGVISEKLVKELSDDL